MVGTKPIFTPCCLLLLEKDRILFIEVITSISNKKTFRQQTKGQLESFDFFFRPSPFEIQANVDLLQTFTLSVKEINYMLYIIVPPVSVRELTYLS